MTQREREKLEALIRYCRVAEEQMALSLGYSRFDGNLEDANYWDGKIDGVVLIRTELQKLIDG